MDIFKHVTDQATEGETNEQSKRTCHKHDQSNGVKDKIFF